jgi:hypothetical protein
VGKPEGKRIFVKPIRSKAQQKVVVPFKIGIRLENKR